MSHLLSSAVNFSQSARLLGPVPKFTAFLGSDDLSIPVLYEVGNSNYGTALFRGDTTMMPTIASLFSLSAQIINPFNVSFIGNAQFVGGAKVFGYYETKAFEHIVELAILGEQRRTGRAIGQRDILIIEDIVKILEYEDFDTNNHLTWLINNSSAGTGISVWAGVNGIVDTKYYKVLSKFQISGQLHPPDNFSARWGESFVRNRIPLHWEVDVV